MNFRKKFLNGQTKQQQPWMYGVSVTRVSASMTHFHRMDLKKHFIAAKQKDSIFFEKTYLKDFGMHTLKILLSFCYLIQARHFY